VGPPAPGIRAFLTPLSGGQAEGRSGGQADAARVAGAAVFLGCGAGDEAGEVFYVPLQGEADCGPGERVALLAAVLRAPVPKACVIPLSVCLSASLT
jgi:hypothetical protein